MPYERIATLEARLDNQGEDLDEIQADVKAIRADVQEIKNTLIKQRGYFAGAMSVIIFLWSAAAGAVVFLWDKVDISRLWS